MTATTAERVPLTLTIGSAEYEVLLRQAEDLWASLMAAHALLDTIDPTSGSSTNNPKPNTNWASPATAARETVRMAIEDLDSLMSDLHDARPPARFPPKEA